MAKYYGPIGYATTVETVPGVWEERIIERNYSGDFIRNTRKLQTAGNVNDNINIANKISIVADPYAYENFFAMRYVKYMGVYWKITDIEVEHPRLVLTLGGVYTVGEA